MGLSDRGKIRRAKGLTATQQKKLQSVSKPKALSKHKKTTATELGLTGEDVAKIVKQTKTEKRDVTSSDFEKAAVKKAGSQLENINIPERTKEQIITGRLRSEDGFAIVESKGRTELATTKAATILSEVRRQEALKQVQEVDLKSDYKTKKTTQTTSPDQVDSYVVEDTFLKEKTKKQVFSPFILPVDFAVREYEKRFQEKATIQKLVSKSIVPKVIYKLPKQQINTLPQKDSFLKNQLNIVTTKISDMAISQKAVSKTLSFSPQETYKILSSEQTITLEQQKILQGSLEPDIKTEVKLLGRSAVAGVTLAGLGVAEGTIATAEFGKEIVTNPIGAFSQAINIPAQVKGVKERLIQEPVSGLVSIQTQFYLVGKGGQAGFKVLSKKSPSIVVGQGQITKGIPLESIKVPGTVVREGIFKELNKPKESIKKYPYTEPKPQPVVAEVPLIMDDRVSISKIVRTDIKTKPPGFEVIDVKGMQKVAETGGRVNPLYQVTGETQRILPSVTGSVKKGKTTTLETLRVEFTPPKIDPIETFRSEPIKPTLSFERSAFLKNEPLTKFEEIPFLQQTGAKQRFLTKEPLKQQPLALYDPRILQPKLPASKGEFVKKLTPEQSLELQSFAKEVGISKKSILNSMFKSKKAELIFESQEIYKELPTDFQYKTTKIRNPTILQLEKPTIAPDFGFDIKPIVYPGIKDNTIKPTKTKPERDNIFKPGIKPGVDNIFNTKIEPEVDNIFKPKIDVSQKITPIDDVIQIQKPIQKTQSQTIIDSQFIKDPFPPKPTIERIKTFEFIQPKILKDDLLERPRKKQSKSSFKNIFGEQETAFTRSAFGAAFRIKAQKTQKLTITGLRI